jgi:glucose-1-phosphate thymidylyltransferase
MKSIIAAGGSGTRMAPSTRWMNKHLIPLMNGELIIDKPLQFLRKHEIEQVTLVTGANHAAQIVEYIGDGNQYGFKRIEYAFQAKPAGISDILNRVSHGDTEDGILLLLGDNYFSSMQTSILELSDTPHFAACWEFDMGSAELAKRFGQFYEDGDGNKSIIEKPKTPIHSRILTGLYFFPSDVFHKVNMLSPSARGELEITDLLKLYLEQNRLEVHTVEGDWADLGEWESLRAYVVNNK